MSKRKIADLNKWLDETAQARHQALELEEEIKDGYWN